MISDEEITLRPTTESDLDFLHDVYRDSRSIELAMVPWDEEQKRLFVIHQYSAQTRHYLEYYPKALHDIVLRNGEPVGRLYVDRGEKTTAILDICVAMKYRRQGVATKVISDLIAEAEANGTIITVSTEPFNPSQSLFKKLGFVVAKEDEARVSFERKPTA